MVNRSRARSVALAMLLVLTTGWGTAEAGNAGDAGMLSLRLGVGVREAAMGGVGVATSRSAAAAYWNPANLVFAEFNTQLILQHYRYLSLFDQESAAVVHKSKAGVFGFLFSGLYSDTIERYGTEPVGVPEGTFRPYDVSLGLSYAHRLGRNFALGATVKMLYERIDVYSDTGFALDLFVSHQAVIDGLTFGASATNLGGQMNLNAEPFDLPSTFRIGVDWVPPGKFFAQKLTLAGDVAFPNDSNEKAHVGAELRLVPQLALRVGTRINYESQGLTAGLGVRVGSVEVGYAYEDMTTEGLDAGHKFALELHY